MLYQHGGASQLETYDLKPDAPTDFRSIYAPIRTAVPGMDICELFPRQALLADKFSIVRSLHHDVSIHSDGGIVVLTGKRPTVLDPKSQSRSEHPDFGHISGKVFGMKRQGLPPYVTIPRKPYMTQPTYLGIQHSAFEPGDPSTSSYTPPQTKLRAGRDDHFLENRRQLLTQLDRLRSDLDLTGHLDGADQFRQRAFQMLTSPEVAAAFDVQGFGTHLEFTRAVQAILKDNITLGVLDLTSGQLRRNVGLRTAFQGRCVAVMCMRLEDLLMACAARVAIDKLSCVGWNLVDVLTLGTERLKVRFRSSIGTHPDH
jgi:hypothetical protein